MFEKKHNEFSRQEPVCGRSPRNEQASAFGCLLILVVFAFGIVPAIGLTAICAGPFVDAQFRKVDRVATATIADCHPDDHDCVYCVRDREYKKELMR
jgi:hypothetical protein